MSLRQSAATAQFTLRRRLRLTPIFQLLRELKRRGLRLKSLDALEMFAYTGIQHTIDYAPYVRSLEAWDIEPGYEAPLRQNLPQATVKIVDSFHELRVTRRKFDLVFADTWTLMFGGHCENFEIFPDVFRVLKDDAVLVLNVMPEWNVRHSTIEHDQRRRQFYQREDVASIPIDAVVSVYEQIISQNGFGLKWWFLKDRYLLYPWRRSALKWRLCYLVLAVRRGPAAATLSAPAVAGARRRSAPLPFGDVRQP